MQQATFSRNILHRLNHALIDLDVDIDALMNRLPNHRSRFDEERPSRVMHSHDSLLWQALESEVEDPFVGLHIGERIGKQRGGMPLEYLFLSCPTFGDALIKLQNYAPLLSDALQIELVRENEICVMRFSFVDKTLKRLRHINDLVLAGFINFFQYVTAAHFRPLWVAVCHAAPHGDKSEYRRAFRCPVRFNDSSYAIAFDADMLEHASLMPEPTLHPLHQEAVDRQMEAMEREALAHKVREFIEHLLPYGKVGCERVAEELNMESRRMRAVLVEYGTTFSEILADCRLELAKRLLSDTHLPIDVILAKTGYSEPGAFYRAFKRGTGLTPIGYRSLYKSRIRNH